MLKSWRDAITAQFAAAYVRLKRRAFPCDKDGLPH
jgi:hypothetical protein